MTKTSETPFQRTHFKLMRTAACTNQTCGQLDEGTERYVCEWFGDHGRCGLIFTSWTRFMAHRTPTTRVEYTASHHRYESLLSRIRVSLVAVHSTVPQQNHVSSQRHWQDSQSHDLASGGHTASCNLCAQEIGDSSNVHRTRPRDASACSNTDSDAQACPACSTAQKTGNTRVMDTSASLGSTKRDGAGAGEQRRRRQLRRTASRTKQDGGANGSTMAVAAKPKADSMVEQKSLNKIMLKGTLKTH